MLATVLSLSAADHERPEHRRVGRQVILRFCAVIVACAVSMGAASMETDRRVAVTVQADGKPQVFEDSIIEYEAVSYVVPVRQGQTLRAVLASSNAANHFDIYAPDAAKPFYVGSESGNSHSLKVPSSGNYTVRVFLLRFAARDGQDARYELELTVSP